MLKEANPTSDAWRIISEMADKVLEQAKPGNFHWGYGRKIGETPFRASDALGYKEPSDQSPPTIAPGT